MKNPHTPFRNPHKVCHSVSAHTFPPNIVVQLIMFFTTLFAKASGLVGGLASGLRRVYVGVVCGALTAALVFMAFLLRVGHIEEAPEATGFVAALARSMPEFTDAGSYLATLKESAVRGWAMVCACVKFVDATRLGRLDRPLILDQRAASLRETFRKMDNK